MAKRAMPGIQGPIARRATSSARTTGHRSKSEIDLCPGAGPVDDLGVVDHVVAERQTGEPDQREIRCLFMAKGEDGRAGDQRPGEPVDRAGAVCIHHVQPEHGYRDAGGYRAGQGKGPHIRRRPAAPVPHRQDQQRQHPGHQGIDAEMNVILGDSGAGRPEGEEAERGGRDLEESLPNPGELRGYADRRLCMAGVVRSTLR